MALFGWNIDCYGRSTQTHKLYGNRELWLACELETCYIGSWWNVTYVVTAIQGWISKIRREKFVFVFLENPQGTRLGRPFRVRITFGLKAIGGMLSRLDIIYWGSSMSMWRAGYLQRFFCIFFRWDSSCEFHQKEPTHRLDRCGWRSRHAVQRKRVSVDSDHFQLNERTNAQQGFSFLQTKVNKNFTIKIININKLIQLKLAWLMVLNGEWSTRGRLKTT